ncbi:MAG: NAD+ synthase [Candidatus Cloacimonetes bacterium]|nr:NAD+ synthase [Candidatus Cloacimonadota bacterium]
MRKIDLGIERKRIIEFIREQLSKAGLDHLIVGISGGIDSAVTAAMCVEAIGKEKVKGFLMPYKASHPDSLLHGRLLAEYLGVEYQKIDISPMVDSYFTSYFPEASALRRGNRMARERMCVLYDQSARYGGLVAGTGNKSELLTGYVTQHGDGACAFEPLGHLYKTEVYELAEMLQIPRELIDKAPTADLWDGQTDESEMGLTYARLDEILYRLYEQQLPEAEIIAEGIEEKDLKRVKELYNKSEFKRNLPPQLELNKV